MPPRRRPAAAVPKVKAKAKVRAGYLRRRPARTEEEPESRVPPVQEWTKVDDFSLDKFPLGSKVLAKIWYAGEEGLICGLLKDETRDSEGKWLGIKLLGTNIAQLRNWALTQGTQSALYLGREPVPLDRRLQAEGIAYLLELKVARDSELDPWMNNCRAEEAQGVETGDLLDAAHHLGAAVPKLQGGPQKGEGEVADAIPPPAPKKLSGRQKVKKMVERSKWSLSGTPLDPSFRRPINLKLKKKKSSSSSSSGSSVSSRSSEDGLGSEHKLRSISRKLPGYLARQSAKEALRLLATQSGEDLHSYQVFNRYYRQVIQPRGGSRGLQRELLTLSWVVDTLLAGNILSALDIMCQRIKSLELLQQGSEANLALQLELLPREQLGLTQDVEGRFAHKEYSAEAKLMRDLKASPLSSGKGGWASQGKDLPNPGPGKGKKGKPWDKNKSKGAGGKKPVESQVIPATPPA